MEGSPHTEAKRFLHDVETTGPPVRQSPYRLKGLDAADLETRITDDLAGGQLIDGERDEGWASPGFVVRSPKVRMVVDYRKVTSRTRKSVFPIPRGDDQKTEVAKAYLVTILDAVWGSAMLKSLEGLASDWPWCPRQAFTYRFACRSAR